jgi:hypothetical protein
MHRIQWQQLGRWAFFALLPVIAAAGCTGQSKVTVSGVVKYKGTPLKGGSVTFNSTAGKFSPVASINEDGTYKIENCPTGPVKITVDTESLKPKFNSGPAMPGQIKAPPAYGPPPGQNEGGYTPPSAAPDMSKRYVQIPLVYSDPKESKLDYTVTTGETTHNIDLD